VDDRDDWAEEVTGRIRRIEGRVGRSDQKRYRIPLLLRLVQHVGAFSSECAVCQDLQGQIEELGAILDGAPGMTRRSFRSYLRIIKGITKHLKRTHGLAEDRQYVKRFVLSGLALGLFLIVLGLILLSFGFTLLALNVTLPALATRVVFAYTIGYLLDRRARHRGKVL
jgi:hypothetical protein